MALSSTWSRYIRFDRDKMFELKTRRELYYLQYDICLYEYIRDTTSLDTGLIKTGTLQLAKRSSDLYGDYDYPTVNINVHYQMRPDETHFSKFNSAVEVVLFKDVRVFYLGFIGRKLNYLTPEEIAHKYLGSSDFSKFFSYISNRADFNRRMSLEYANDMELVPRHALAVAKTVPLLGTHNHPLYPTQSSLQKYWAATKKSVVSPFEKNASLSSRREFFDMTAYPLSAAIASTIPYMPNRVSAALGALSLVPALRSIHRNKKDIDSDEKSNSRRLSEQVAASLLERDVLLTNGALPVKLMQRLSQNPFVHPNVGKRDAEKLFMNMHGRVHKSSIPRGGSKKTKTRNPNKTRKNHY